MKAYYGDRFSTNMTETPEGYLICHNVPIARTGNQQYFFTEIGVKGEGLATVIRTPEEVFKASAMASFEGKPVTDDHPPEWLGTTNYSAYTRGVAQNVRRGLNTQADFLLADLLIYDAVLISEINEGKREVSCGYGCDYLENEDGTYDQVNIKGNHVAVVTKGRAGSQVQIKDEEPPNLKGAKKHMAKEKNILHRMLEAFVKDAEPSDILEASKAVNDAEATKEPAKVPAADDAPAPDASITALQKKIADLSAKVDAIIGAEKKEPEHKDDEIASLDSLEKELDPEEKTEDDDEESVTVPVEEINKEDDKPAPVATDHALIMSALRTLKPIVATFPAGQRKLASDALSKAMRDAMGVQITQKASNAYAAVMQRKVSDADPDDKSKFGENCAKLNPHTKKEDK